MIRKVVCIMLLAASFSGCYYDVESELYGGGCDLPQTISYSTDIQPIMDTWCAISGCHVQDGTGSGLLDSYEGVITKLDDGTLENALFVDKDMPPNSTFPPCHAQAVKNWIEQGALDN
jgi:hypothetical protein